MASHSGRLSHPENAGHFFSGAWIRATPALLFPSDVFQKQAKPERLNIQDWD